MKNINACKKKEGLLLYNFISFLHLSVWSKKDIF